uniref:SH2 domain-containing protein n=1 Tax=Castor canadensis TaxID=51338 RepID=A0A8C0WNQ0_CASCN
MTESGKLPPPLPPRLGWFVHTQVDELTQGGIPDWFHGTISREAAENLLESQPPGSFLVRVSHSHVGYTISYKAQSCCRHLMVKLLDDGSVVIPGEKVAHASLHALVTFHRREPFGRWDELLTHPCGQKDPANVDYEDLLLYSSTLAQEADGPRLGLQDPQRPSCFPEMGSPEAVDGETQGEAVPSFPPKAPFGETRQKLWENLKSLPQTSKKVRQQLKSHMAAVNLSLRDTRKSAGTPLGSRTFSGRQDNSGNTAWRKDISKDLRVATSQAPRDTDTSSRKATRSISWSEVTTGVKGWQQTVMRTLSSQTGKPETSDLAESQDAWLPEEYLPPPPFAPGYY